MSKVPTAKEFLVINGEQDFTLSRSLLPISEIMIGFAKLHVQAALQAAASNVEADLEPMNWLAEQHANTPFIEGEDYEIGISRQSILLSYPEINIK